MGAYCLMIDVIETRVPSFDRFFEDLLRTSICLAIVQTMNREETCMDEGSYMSRGKASSRM